MRFFLGCGSITVWTTECWEDVRQPTHEGKLAWLTVGFPVWINRCRVAVLGGPQKLPLFLCAHTDLSNGSIRTHAFTYNEHHIVCSSLLNQLPDVFAALSLRLSLNFIHFLLLSSIFLTEFVRLISCLTCCNLSNSLLSPVQWCHFLFNIAFLLNFHVWSTRQKFYVRLCLSFPYMGKQGWQNQAFMLI